jgi:outer membrane protein insertion porin family
MLHCRNRNAARAVSATSSVIVAAMAATLIAAGGCALPPSPGSLAHYRPGPPISTPYAASPAAAPPAALAAQSGAAQMGASPSTVVRGQAPESGYPSTGYPATDYPTANQYPPANAPENPYAAGSDSLKRYPMAPSQAPANGQAAQNTATQAQYQQAPYQQAPAGQQNWQTTQNQPATEYNVPGPGAGAQVYPDANNSGPYNGPYTGPYTGPGVELPMIGPPGNELGLPPDFAQPPLNQAIITIPAQEARTGRFMIGAAVNSDAGVTGQVTIDERNFDISKLPTSWSDVLNGTAFRGAGQGFRAEAAPGSQVQRYLVSFTEPYLLDTNVSFNVSAFFYDRNFFDWNEQRYGGRVAFGYRLSPDLSVTAALRAENVDITDPRVRGVPQLEEALGNSDLFSGRLGLIHDTRDIPFAPTEGHYFELSYEQVFGSFDYPRAEIDLRQYFLVRERPDGSGRHTIGFMFRTGFSGSQTPIYENYFAGGFSTLRGFRFRGASPRVGSVIVGGEFRMLGSAEYTFPITADDMIKGVAFVDFGTVEEEIELSAENYRVAPGVGLRMNIPALGPAPLALDFAFPVAQADGDQTQIFSFFLGAMR